MNEIEKQYGKGARLVTGEDVPEEIRAFVESLSSSFGQDVRVVDMSNVDLEDDADFLGEVTNGAAEYVEAPMNENVHSPEGDPVGDFFKRLFEQMEAQSLDEMETPAPTEPVTEEELQDLNEFKVSQDIIENLVSGQLAMSQAMVNIFNVLKNFMTAEEIEQIDDLAGLGEAHVQAAQINHASILGQAKGFALARYGVEWEDIPYESQRKLLEWIESRN